MLRLGAIGVAAGLFGALLGVGGGIVVVPLLVYLLGFDQRRAAATSLGAIGITAAAGALSYGAQGYLRPAEAMLVGVPALLGMLGGTALQQRIPLRPLQLLFAGLAALVGLRLLVPGVFAFGEVEQRTWWVYPLAAAVGVLGGLLGGLFGVGGGIVFVPTLVLALGLSHLEAAASSLLAMLPALWLGAWRQTRYRNLAWRAAIAIGATSVAGVWAGIAVAERLPEAALRTLFGALLLATAGQLGWRARRR